jgi:hypothetical protein
MIYIIYANDVLPTPPVICFHNYSRRHNVFVGGFSSQILEDFSQSALTIPISTYLFSDWPIFFKCTYRNV